jgi:hypothetical protein
MNKITLIDYLSLSEKELLVEQLNGHHEVILEELTKLANNKLFKVQSSFTVKQNEIYDFHMVHAIEACYRDSRNAKALMDMTGKLHFLIRDAVDQLERSIKCRR